jgi:chemosensory pili system protein ChpC
MNSSLQSTDSINELATLLVPVSGRQLVLPNVTVAEIIPYMQPQADDSKPDWFLGMFTWRNTGVPLVSFEKLNGESHVEAGSSPRIAVLNGIVDGQNLPFCGIVTTSAPRLMRIISDEISPVENTDHGPAELSKVMVSGEHAVIPNVDYIQQEILKVL